MSSIRMIMRAVRPVRRAAVIGAVALGVAGIATDARAAGFQLKEQSASALGNAFAGSTAGADATLTNAIDFGTIAGIGSSTASADLTLPDIISAGVHSDIDSEFAVMAEFAYTLWSTFDELRVQGKSLGHLRELGGDPQRAGEEQVLGNRRGSAGRRPLP